ADPAKAIAAKIGPSPSAQLPLLAVTRGRVQMEGAGEWLERGATLLVPAAAAAGSFRPEGTAELLEIQIP
ncbi:MAG: hypothetical protein ACK6CE_12805, partial [Planctomycetota bacterium]